MEALLFAHGEPLGKRHAADLLGVDPLALDRAAEALRTQLAGRGIALVDTQDALELRTSPMAADTVAKLRAGEATRELGKASLETLALVLYQGGATRSEIDWVRGVNSGAALRTLLMRGLVEKDADGKRYVATADALGHLGAARATDLPRYAELSAAIRDADVASTPEESADPA